MPESRSIPFYGVYFANQPGKFEARFFCKYAATALRMLYGKATAYLGIFTTPLQAAAAVDEALDELGVPKHLRNLTPNGTPTSLEVRMGMRGRSGTIERAFKAKAGLEDPKKKKRKATDEISTPKKKQKITSEVKVKTEVFPDALEPPERDHLPLFFGEPFPVKEEKEKPTDIGWHFEPTHPISIPEMRWDSETQLRKSLENVTTLLDAERERAATLNDALRREREHRIALEDQRSALKDLLTVEREDRIDAEASAQEHIEAQYRMINSLRQQVASLVEQNRALIKRVILP